MVTLDRAALWTDSRYWTQAERQLDCNWELQRTSQGRGGWGELGGVPACNPPPAVSLLQRGSSPSGSGSWSGFPQGATSAWTPSSSPSVGLAGTGGGPYLMGCTSSPWVWRGRSLLHAPPSMGCFSPSDTWNSYSQALQGSGRALVPIETNLVDQVWGDQRPPPASSEIYSLPAEFTGTKLPPKHTLAFIFFGGAGSTPSPREQLAGEGDRDPAADGGAHPEPHGPAALGAGGDRL